MQNYWRLGVGWAVFALAGCSTLNVGTDFNPQADFSKYQTYGWLPSIRSETPENPLTAQKVRTSVEKQMDREGLLKSSPGERPDFLIAFRVIHRDVRLPYDWDTGFRLGDGNAQSELGFGYATESHQEGSLVLDFIDARTRQVFWRGTASDVIERAEVKQKDVAQAVDKILEKYPPKPREIQDQVS